jgi:TetR/AcrR family transcriptional repressor of nem operon
MRYDTEHKQRTREKVLKVAARAIRSAGPHRVGVAEVMAKAGLTHGGFYAHFESKDDLISAAIGRMFAEAEVRLLKETSGKSTAQALGSYIDFYLSAAHRDAVAIGCPIPILAPELHRIAKSARQQFSIGVRKLTGVIASHLAQLGRKHPEDDASSMVAELVGALSLSRAEPDAEKSDAILKASRRSLKARFELQVP